MAQSRRQPVSRRECRARGRFFMPIACGIVLLAGASVPSLSCGFGAAGTRLSEADRAAQAHFNDVKKQIDEGRRYMNLSTPLDGLLSYTSALLRKDPADLSTTSARRFSEGRTEVIPSHFLAMYRDIRVDTTPPVPPNPKDGDLHPVFVTYGGNVKGIEVMFYEKGGWTELLNQVQLDLDWRAAAEKTLSLDQVKIQIQH